MTNMLNKKVSHKKLRPDAPKEPKYLNYLHEIKQPVCFVCSISLGIQIHHIKENSSDYRDDTKVIPLCFEHHHGTELSPHGNPKAWRYSFTMEEQLESAEKLYTEYKKGK